ncbi:hypothetical protein SeMB42_g02549 [Synchytrium endobioticum]|uniref:STAS domain-containing protein n=1 Tax=Synchytrium endobioticum TaxID=286115 RepID=A0A507DJV1_9FUNG|nr:hypothetical protein SeMB42_g02549 [Synchytrium endobioticum]TPX51457.1 hypothetical protein SeLEV6574_g00236 [Synchytrium endobioticum]
MADFKAPPTLGHYQEALPTFLELFSQGGSDSSHVSMDERKPFLRRQLEAYFPFTQWITRYNWTWFMGDLIAGVTVAAVAIPQSMAYAKLASLPPQFGLYSAFVGVTLYFFWATSKDVTIGPVAVLSQLTGSILVAVAATNPEYSGIQVAAAIAITAGAIVLLIGILRLGFIVDFIPLPAISSFVTGAAINILVGQLPTLVGTSKLFDTREATYLVFINFLRYLPDAKLDAALGVSALALLYSIRWLCQLLGERHPKYEKVMFMTSTLRSVFIIIFYTIISFVINSGLETPRTSLLGKIPAGLQNVGVPQIDFTLIGIIGPYLPSVVIIMLIEHIAIAKAFSRINQYTINPSQELIAIAMANILGPFFGAYPVTGSFSRTAIKAKSGVRTPLAGVLTSIVVIVAIFLLPPLFYWISNAALAAVIIHAVGDLISSSQYLRDIWNVDPVELLLYTIGLSISIFTNIENGIYFSVGAAGVVLLYRLANPKGQFLGRITVYDIALKSTGDKAVTPKFASRHMWVPLDHTGSNPDAVIQPPPPGVFVYRLNEGYVYPNANLVLDRLVDYIKAKTRPGTLNVGVKNGDLPWNQQPYTAKITASLSERPVLLAVIIDLTGVSRIDFTASQALLDIRRTLEKYAGRPVSFHFVCASSGWVKRALIASDFGGGVGTAPVFPAIAAITPERRLVSLLDHTTPYLHNSIEDAVTAAERMSAAVHDLHDA